MSTTILLQPLTPEVRNYTAAFDLHPIIRFADGRIKAAAGVAGGVETFWCEGKRDAHLVAELAAKQRLSIPEAARLLHIRVGPHAQVVAKATACVERINGALVKAHGNGA